MSNPVSVLNELIESLKDGQEGFRAAGEAVKSSELKTLFGEFSLQRSKFAGELQALAQSLGESEPEKTGSVTGAIHRGWIDLKSAVVAQDEHAILAECERGEDFAVASYKKALESGNLPANVLATVETQSQAVKAAHDKIKGLRDATA